MKAAVSIMLALALAGAASAQDKAARDDKPPKVETVIPQAHTTKHSGVFGGQKIRYTATIGETILSDKDGTQKAAIVTTSYVKEPRDPSRPAPMASSSGPIPTVSTRRRCRRCSRACRRPRPQPSPTVRSAGAAVGRRGFVGWR